MLALGLVLVAVSFFGASRIGMSTGTETFLSTDSEAYQDYQRFNEDFGSSSIVVMVTAEGIDGLLSEDNVRAMEHVETTMGAHPKVISAIGPTFLMKQAVAQFTGTPMLPDDREMVKAIVVDDQTGEIREQFRTALPDQGHAIIPVVMEGMYFADDEVSDLLLATDEAVAEAGFAGVEVALTGPAAFMSRIQDAMTTNMAMMFLVSIVLMLGILAIIFTVRGFFAWRWLPLAVVGIGIIFTFGFTGLLSIPITMVSMSAFPILVGLGIDYSIQLHSRYDDELRRGRTSSEAVRVAVSRVGPTIGIALVAVCLSCVALLFSPIPMIQDFGLMLLIGVSVCYLAALFVPLAVLHWRERRKVPKEPERRQQPALTVSRDGAIERALGRMVPWVIRYPAVIIVVAVGLSGLGFVYDSRIETETNEVNMMSPDWPAMSDYQTLREVMAGEVSLNVLVEAEDVSRPEVLQWMRGFEERVCCSMSDDVCGTTSIADLICQANGGGIPQDGGELRECLDGIPGQVRRNLISDDFESANIVVGLLRTEQTEVEQLREVRGELLDYAGRTPAGVNLAVTGARSLGPDLLDAFTSGRMRITLISVGLIFVGLLVLFRFSVLKALMATVPIGLIIGWSSGLMYASGMKYTALTACLGALILGIGVEYTIVLMKRYYEERDSGEAPAQAMNTAIRRIGRPVLASGLTTIGGFAALIAAGDFLILQQFGIMTVVDVFLALVSTLLLLPALVVWVDSRRERRRPALARYSLDEIMDGLEGRPADDEARVTSRLEGDG